MNESPQTVAFCDTSNKVINNRYADRLRAEFRKLTGWKVESDTRIWRDLGDFSMGYSRDKRDVTEVAVIFMMAAGIPPLLAVLATKGAT